MANILPVDKTAATSSTFTNADGSSLTLYLIGETGTVQGSCFIDIQYQDSNSNWNTVKRLGNNDNSCVLLGAGTFQAVRYANSGNCGLDSQ
jgi:hypothetical protein